MNLHSESARHEEIQKEIDELRRQIDLINLSLVDLLNLRQMHVIRILKLKENISVPLKDPGREEQMLAKAIASNKGPIHSDTVRDVLSAIFRHTLKDLPQ